jgi:hypothetical protein
LISLICRIAERDPYTDILYGSGYGTERAKRYEWLLTLNERIPDDTVETETEKYWERVRIAKEAEEQATMKSLLDNSDSGHRSDFSVPFHPADLQLDSS